MQTLRKVKIEGFKSIERAELTLGDLNVVIGANGSGKSNLIGVFRLLERVLSRNLQVFVASEPDRLLHHGRRVTPSLSLDFAFWKNAYGFTLNATQDSLTFANERVEYSGVWNYGESLAVGHKESMLEQAAMAYKNKIPQYVSPKVRNLVVYPMGPRSWARSVFQPFRTPARTLRAGLPHWRRWQQAHEALLQRRSVWAMPNDNSGLSKRCLEHDCTCSAHNFQSNPTV